MERVDGLGQGERTEVAPAAALAITRESRPDAPAGVDAREPNGLTAGMREAVTPDHYGFDPVQGQLVGSSEHEVAVRRKDRALDEIAVHFPRVGFRVTRVE